MDITIENSLMDSKENEFKTGELCELNPCDVFRIGFYFVNKDGDIRAEVKTVRITIYGQRLNSKGSYHNCFKYYWKHIICEVIHGEKTFAAFRIAYTLAWRCSSVTDKNDPEFQKWYDSLLWIKFNQIPIADEQESTVKRADCTYVDSNEDRELKDKVAELNKRISEYEGKIAELNAELKKKNLTPDNSAEETSARGANLQTGEVLHLVEHSGIRNGNESSNMEWAVVLHLLTGCSVNTLRQKMSKPDLSDGARGKVEKLYNEALDELKKKNKGSV